MTGGPPARYIGMLQTIAFDPIAHPRAHSGRFTAVRAAEGPPVDLGETSRGAGSVDELAAALVARGVSPTAVERARDLYQHVMLQGPDGVTSIPPNRVEDFKAWAQASSDAEDVTQAFTVGEYGGRVLMGAAQGFRDAVTVAILRKNLDGRMGFIVRTPSGFHATTGQDESSPPDVGYVIGVLHPDGRVLPALTSDDRGRVSFRPASS